MMTTARQAWLPASRPAPFRLLAHSELEFALKHHILYIE
jgi:hypothetical protein